ncbi:hypothetical protein BC835DRAFT_1354907 [Cytidiella melzeri]|nr:hypothetical protein BC835DRAFT_1354907 [Cytidiella melzeri]
MPVVSISFIFLCCADFWRQQYSYRHDCSLTRRGFIATKCHEHQHLASALMAVSAFTTVHCSRCEQAQEGRDNKVEEGDAGRVGFDNLKGEDWD